MKRTWKKMMVIVMIVVSMIVSTLPVYAASRLEFSSLKASNITVSSARVDFTTINKSRMTVKNAGLQIRKKGASAWTTKTDTVSGSYRTAATLKSWYLIGSGKEVNFKLAAGTTYEYRGFAKSGSTTYYSSIKTFTTPKPAVPKAPSVGSLRTSSLTSSSVRIDFTTSNPGRLSISNAGLQIRKKGNSSWTTKTDTVASSYKTSATLSSWYLVGSGKEVNFKLSPSTTYEYRGFCKTGGKTYFSSIASFTTPKSGSSSTKTICGNGTGGITINISGAPYSTRSAANAYGQKGCTWFAACRVQQLTGKYVTIYRGDDWYNSAYKTYGFKRGDAPRARALACYGNHVIVIEKVVGNDVYISEGGCNFGGAGASTGYCRIAKVNKKYIEETAVKDHATGKFLGYIYF